MLAARGGFPGIGQMSEATSSARTVSRRASLTMLKFSGDEFDALELVHRPTEGPVYIGTGFSHLAIQIDNLKATVEAFPWSKQHRPIPPPAQSAESGDDRSPHSVSGSNCNHGVEGGHHGEICSALTRRDKKESMSALETPLAKTSTSGTDGLLD